MRGEATQARWSKPTHLIGDLTGGTPEAVSLIKGLLQDVTRALFASYGVTLELDGTPADKMLGSVRLIGMIGFSSTEVSGSLLLALTEPLLQRTRPAAGAPAADWTGELANQLLGRFKNQLLSYGVLINSSLPVVVAGETLALPARTRPLTRHLSFASRTSGRLFVRLEMELAPALELVRLTEDDAEPTIDEGELVLF